MSLSHSPRIVTDELVLCLDAANTKSYPGTGTTWYDLSGNGNNMTLSNVSYGANVLSFNGVSSYGDLGSNFTLSTSGSTISSWIKISNFTSLSGSHTQPARVFVTSEERTFRNLIAFWDGEYGWEGNTNGDPYEINTIADGPVIASGITPLSWFNFTLSFTSSVAYGYVNGSFVSSIATSNNILYRYLGISSVSDVYPDYLLGDVGVFSVYNRGLTESEIQQNFQALRGRYGI